MNDQTQPAPEHWADLTEEQRAELVAMADARITSRKVYSWFWRRMERIKGLGTVILTVAAVWVLIGDALAEVLNRWLDR